VNTNRAHNRDGPPTVVGYVFGKDPHPRFPTDPSKSLWRVRVLTKGRYEHKRATIDLDCVPDWIKIGARIEFELMPAGRESFRACNVRIATR
jgi:hypothetical protein